LLNLNELTIKDWYEYDVHITMELMESFIDGVEAQALRLIEEFHDKKEMHEVTVEGYPEHSYAVTVFQGLDDQTWDIHSVFNDHFPNLQRRSALLTLVDEIYVMG